MLTTALLLPRKLRPDPPFRSSTGWSPEFPYASERASLCLRSTPRGRSARQSAAIPPRTGFLTTGHCASDPGIKDFEGPQKCHRTRNGERKSKSGPLCWNLLHPSRQVPAGSSGSKAVRTCRDESETTASSTSCNTVLEAPYGTGRLESLRRLETKHQLGNEQVSKGYPSVVSSYRGTATHMCPLQYSVEGAPSKAVRSQAGLIDRISRTTAEGTKENTFQKCHSKCGKTISTVVCYQGSETGQAPEGE